MTERTDASAQEGAAPIPKRLMEHIGLMSTAERLYPRDWRDLASLIVEALNQPTLSRPQETPAATEIDTMIDALQEALSLPSTPLKACETCGVDHPSEARLNRSLIIGLLAWAKRAKRERPQETTDQRIAEIEKQLVKMESSRDNVYPMDFRYLRSLIADALTVLQQRVEQLTTPFTGTAMSDELHHIFTNHGVPSRAHEHESLVTAVVSWAARACRQSKTQELHAAEQRVEQLTTLAGIGTWHDGCRPNREMAARELAKSQAIIDKLADTITKLNTRVEQLEQATRYKEPRYKQTEEEAAAYGTPIREAAREREKGAK